MRLLFSCTECSNEASIGEFVALEPLDLADNGLYELTCSKGHVTYHNIVNPKFEILVELACTAICDGYYRDAVASFTAGLERFYEFYLAVIMHSRKIDSEIFANSWKNIKSQSERQLGAYVFIYTSQHKQTPQLLSNKNVQFRNSVAHKGQIPTRAEAIKYGDAVIAIISPVLQILMSEHESSVLGCFTRDVQRQDYSTTTTLVSSRTISSVFSRQSPLGWTELSQVNIENRVKHISSIKDKRYF